MPAFQSKSAVPKRSPSKVIAIVGAGFCGTMVATHLLRQLTDPHTEVMLINRPHPEAKSTLLARGLAYGTNSAMHLLNVPAGRMSAFDGQPDDFLAFLHANKVMADGGSFVPRHWYGAYLQAILNDAADRTVASYCVRKQTVSSILPTDPRQTGYELRFDDGDTVVADCVVLALGNFLPDNPIFVDPQLAESKRYVRDPWAEGAVDDVDLNQPVLLVGTGLTMFDMVVSLKARVTPNQTLRIQAVSRRGLLPQSHRTHTSMPSFDLAPPAIFAKASARAYLRAVREQIAAIEKSGGDWRDVLASLRPITPALWHGLPIIERRRFLRHLKPYWETHRHRAAPVVFDVVNECLKQGEVELIAAKVLALDESTDGFRVQLQKRGGIGSGFDGGNGERPNVRAMTIKVGTIINCTGPSSDIGAEPLLVQMASSGLIAADSLRLGIEVADDYRVCDQHGQNNAAIYYVGPLLKARDWEAIAVPELRVHARAVSNAVIKKLTAD